MKLLFYSDRCKHSVNLLNLLQEIGELKDIKLICVDNENVPPKITKVPTYITSEINHPLIGKEIFKFFDILEFFDKPTNNIKFWKEKVIKRPTIDNFMKGKEHQMKYQIYQDNLSNNTNAIKDDRNEKEFNKLVNERKVHFIN